MYDTFPLNRLNTSLAQVVLLGLACLCCPGMFNALSGLGAGGSLSSNVTITDAANSVLYGCFAIVGFFAGSITNKLGVKTTFTAGSIGYAIYAASLWVYDRKQVSGFVIAAGAILGCCAGLFWSAQGSIMMSYPEEKNKGKYVAIFWTLFNIGGILGSVITLGLNLQNQGGSVSTASYIAFVVIMLVGVLFTLVLAPPSLIVRPDGTKVTVHEASSWSTEIKGVIQAATDRRMLALMLAFLASNWFYSYQFHVNAVFFDAPTRALNGTMYWAMQIVGSLFIGFILDWERLGNRRSRGFIGFSILVVITCAIWAGGIAFQTTFSNDYSSPIHFTNDAFGRPFVLYIFYGFSDAAYQTYLYWLMGAMSNDPIVLARYAGLYKALQSAGAAISFGIDAASVDLIWECVICFVLLFASFIPMSWAVSQITETNVTDDDVIAGEKAIEAKEESQIAA